MKEGILKDVLEGRKYNTDLMLVFILTILGTMCVFLLPGGNYARVVLGLSMLIFFPGYALVSALWPEGKSDGSQDSGSPGQPGGSEKRFPDNIERIALSFGLSIVIVVLVGLLLNFTSIGITTESTVICNMIVIIVILIIAFYRRTQLPAGKAFYTDMTFPNSEPREKEEKVITIAIAICLVLAGITLAYALTVPNVEQHYTSFYILNANGTAQDYPVNLTVTSIGTVIVGVSCHEYASTDYTILVGIEGANDTQTYNNWEQTYLLSSTNLITRNITLDHMDSFEDEFSFNIPNAGTYKITWQLYIGGTPTEYSTHLWVNVHDN